MAVHRAALLWASLTLAVIMHGMVKGQQGPSIPMDYCATVNTGSMGPFTSIYQSDGRCFGNCSDRSYAFAIVHEMRCWCSNLIPNRADRRPLEECQYPCPGYPPDYCGGDGVFGYMEIGGFQPSGTARPGFGLSSTETPPSTSADDGSQDIRTVTVGGVVRTVTTTLDPTDTNGPALAGNEDPGLQTGAIVGIVVGVIGGVAVLAAFIWLFLKRRKRNADEGTGYVSPMRGGGGSPGVMATPTTGEMTGGGIAGAADPQPSQAWDSTRRRSHLMPVDPRLDPFATGIYAGDPNKSRESVNSLQDNHDYSRRVHEPPRVLRAMNPDPDDD
ncbi:Cell wall integrity and stress response component 4 [Madurella mycetomatis]|uniref:Cell wall integrity and stress response component 4 n=1 Tax=Madurella mycetomatis TaxID=100816 RepID=A0A175VSP6_9PEZI|nr:Cell wall integrity and stress response component 4 [Madurella mycetomatis]